MRFPTDLDRLQSDMELRILTNGYTMQGVMAGPHKVGWTYTIGLTESFDLPELVITNLDSRDAVVLLSWVVEQLRDGTPLDELDPEQFTAVPVHRKHLDGDLLNMWRYYYDKEPHTVDVVQLRLGDELACPCCANDQVDLSDPHATLGITRRMNRAQRRRQRKILRGEQGAGA